MMKSECFMSADCCCIGALVGAGLLWPSIRRFRVLHLH
jgi:hypothetical protein